MVFVDNLLFGIIIFFDIWVMIEFIIEMESVVGVICGNVGVIMFVLMFV